MEQVRRRIHMELVSNDARVQKLINLTMSYNENLSAITLEKKIIKFDKPIYVGMYQTCLYHYYFLIVIFCRSSSVGYIKDNDV